MLKSALLNETNYTLTENGAATHRSTKSHVLDLFTLGAVANGVNVNSLIKDALMEDPRLAIKVIFYLSDIREGQGRRDFFRTALKAILSEDPRVAKALLKYIPEFGRWDYLYWFVGTELEYDALELMAKEAKDAMLNNKASLVFKWMASADASSAETKHNAEITRKHFRMTPRKYRKMLSWGRKMLAEAVVENKMSHNEWSGIDYSKVPSVAMKKYRKAFNLHSPEKFVGFIKKVQTGEAKINSSVLYPSDIIHAGAYLRKGVERDALVAQWKALPNYLTEGVRALAVVDTSGSMSGLPLEVATSLGLYLSERMTGEFHNAIISFSAKAKIFDLPNGDIFDKYNYLERQNICENTNLQSVFELLLGVAKRAHVPNEQMPNRIIIISDMEFDNATGNYSFRRYDNVARTTNLDAIKQKYEMAGYEFPQIIFWTVDARQKQVPATMNEEGVILVGGYSPVIMKSVLSNDPYITPYKAMLKTVEVERYAFVDEII